MCPAGFRNDADFDKPSSFAVLPLRQYKYIMTRDMGRSQQYRVIPSFVYAQTGSDFGTIAFPGTLFSYYLNKEYVVKGFEMRFDYCHGKTIIYKKGFTRHQPYSYSKHLQPYTETREVTGNGEIMYSFDYKTIGTVSVATDNYEIMYKTLSLSRADLTSIEFEKRFYNYSGDLSWHLPDMGCNIR
jgi:hypothetical protein